VRAESQSRHVDVSLLIDLEEGEAAAVKTGALKKGELIGEGTMASAFEAHPKAKFNKGIPPTAALFDDPRHFAVQPFVSKILGTSAQMPNPRLTTSSSHSSSAARLAMILSTPHSMGLKSHKGRKTSPLMAGL
jgi:hypothetical protein